MGDPHGYRDLSSLGGELIEMRLIHRPEGLRLGPLSEKNQAINNNEVNNMKRVLLGVLSVLYFSVAAGADDKITISVSGSYSMIFLSAGIAQKRGFFKQEGLDADILVMRPATSIAALSSGDIDYTMLTGSVIRAAIAGFPFKVVAGFVNSSPHALLGRPEFKSVKDLKGRTVGVGNFGSATHVLARMIIKHFGIDPDKETQIIALGGDAARLAGLQKGLADAAMTSPPWDFEGKKMGYVILARAYEFLNYPLSGLGVHARKLQQKPGEVKRVIKTLIKASRFIRENRNESIQVLAEWGKVPKEHALASYDSTVKVVSMDGTIPGDGLRLLMDESRKETKVAREVSVNEVTDFALLLEAQRELGVKKP